MIIEPMYKSYKVFQVLPTKNSSEKAESKQIVILKNANNLNTHEKYMFEL